MARQNGEGSLRRMNSARAHILVNAGNDHSILRFRWSMIEALRAKGHKVSICLWGGDHTADEACTAADIPVKRLSRSHLGIGAGDALALRSFRRWVAEAGIDTMLSCNGKAIVLGNLALTGTKRPRSVVLIEGLGEAFGAQGSPIRQARAKLGLAGLGVALMRAQHILVLNAEDEALAKRLAPSKKSEVTRLRGIGVDLDRFAPTPLPPAQPPLKAIMIARLVEEKGPRIYAEAGRLLRAKGVPVELHLLGEFVEGGSGVERDEVDGWEQEGVLVYHAPRADVRPLIESAHVLVLPSHYREGLPATLMEAAAMGRPVITTDNPGCREALSPGETGLMIPPRDPQALATALQEIAANPTRLAPMGTAARCFAEAYFDRKKADATFIKALLPNQA